MNPGSFFKLSFCTFTCLSNNFMDFSQIYISTSPMYALPVKQLSARSKHLNVFEKGGQRPLHCRLIVDIRNLDP